MCVCLYTSVHEKQNKKDSDSEFIQGMYVYVFLCPHMCACFCTNTHVYMAKKQKRDVIQGLFVCMYVCMCVYVKRGIVRLFKGCMYAYIHA